MIQRPLAVAARLALATALATALAACAYDYTQRTDRVAYNTGNAVKANIEMQTVDPSSGNMYKTKGLGKNGVVVDTTPPDPSSPGISSE